MGATLDPRERRDQQVPDVTLLWRRGGVPWPAAYEKYCGNGAAETARVDLASLSVYEIGLNIRSANALYEFGFHTAADLAEACSLDRENVMLECSGFGWGMLVQVYHALERQGVPLDPEKVERAEREHAARKPRS